MEYFTVIPEGQAIMVSRGVYRQVPVYARGGKVYARHGGGYLYSKPADVVMDPFNGIGSTGYQAVKMGRRYLGFELKPEYAEQAGKNLKDAELMAGDVFGLLG